MMHHFRGKWLALAFAVSMSALLLAAATPLSPGETRKWTGAGADALASNGANWEGGVAPAAGDDILLDATGTAHPMTWDLDIPVNSWTQDGYANTVTIATTFAQDGFAALVINGDCLLRSGAWTHKDNARAETYRLKASIGGALTIGPDAKITATGLGYDNGVRPAGESPIPIYSGGAYAAQAGTLAAVFTPQSTYGSLFRPENLGSGGAQTAGGGAIWLEIGGALSLEGEIDVDSKGPTTYYSGSGGSVFIRAASISGGGTVSADSAKSQACGSGGRIAIILTGEGADFTDYDVIEKVSALSIGSNNAVGGCGTIYLETVADGANGGWLVMKGHGMQKPRFPESAEMTLPPFGETMALSRITLTNCAVLRLPEKADLDLTGTKLETKDAPGNANGFLLHGGRILWNRETPFSFDYQIRSDLTADLRIDAPALTIAGGGLLDICVPTRITGSVSVRSNGLYRTSAPVTVEGDFLLSPGAVASSTGPTTLNPPAFDLTVTGDLTISEGAKIDQNGRGFEKTYGPGFGEGSVGGCHGGISGHPWVGTIGKAYGSIRDPRTSGSGGNSTPGGGAVLLTAGGQLTVNGVIDACGSKGDHYTGSGGSVNIHAVSIAGTGAIKASSSEKANFGTGAGGRIAIALSGPESTFAPYTGTIEAFGALNGNVSGGAGTIYLREKGQAIDEGTLLLSNGKALGGGVTPLAGTPDELSFGAVILRDHALGQLTAGSTLGVSGVFSNGASFFTEGGSTVDLRGSSPSTLHGDTTFAILSSSAPGKEIAFAAGSTQSITGLLAIAGTGDAPIVLRSMKAGDPWFLPVTGNANVKNVSVSDSDASGGTTITAINSVDGGNNVNWSFLDVVVGETVTWTGAADTSWDNPANWTPARLPIAEDKVVVPAGAGRQPALGSPVTVSELSVASGMELWLGGQPLTVTGDLSVGGTLVAAGSETITLRGGVTIQSASATYATFVIDGTAPQALSLPSDLVGTVRIENASGVTFARSATAREILCGDGHTAFDLAVAPGSAIKVQKLVLAGDPATANLTLRGQTQGGRWNLLATASDVTGVTVRDSRASSDAPIYPKSSVDGGGNRNWYFSDSRNHWTGAVDDDFAEAGNWADGVVPEAYDDVYIAGGAVRISDCRQIGSLTVGAGGVVTIAEEIIVNSSVTIEQGGTIFWDRPASIAGNLTILEGGLLSHTANGKTEDNKLDLFFFGNGYIARGGMVDVTGKGYATQSGPGYNSDGFHGSSHGGRGHLPGNSNLPCYGSIVCPTNCGSGGASLKAGGGAVSIRFSGRLELDGAIVANGIGIDEQNSVHYCGTGGSVQISAGSLTGGGLVSANGGDHPDGGFMSGGGRVAIKLHISGADFSDFNGAIEAYASRDKKQLLRGCSGTIYLETAEDPVDGGTIFVDGGKGMSDASTFSKTDFPSTLLCEEGETERTRVVVKGDAYLHLMRDTTVEDIHLEGAHPVLRLNGHTLTVRSKPHALGLDEQKQVTYADGGQVIWLPHGGPTLLMIR